MALDTDELIAALSDPTAYDVTGPVEVCHTHISAVFLAADRAYKLKKPVDLGFVDYSTPELRRSYCEAEVRLNRRLAPGVYLGVRAVVPRGDGVTLSEADDPRAIDWVVEMQRLDDDDRFLAHLHAGTLRPEWLAELGNKIAAFHDRCAAGQVGRYGSYETVSTNALDNFSQSDSQVGATVARPVFAAARAATEHELGTLRRAIERRDRDGETRDTHGDLRLEHVYQHGGELVVVDCIEFNEAFRFADPIADIAFLVMDLRIRWHADLAKVFTDAYFDARPGGEELLEFYVAYRSAVRAKVHGIAATSEHVDDATRERGTVKSRAHWLFTWSTLAPPDKRPCLVIVGGLPATGKSTLARTLASDFGFQHFDSDHVRKELAGVAPETVMRAAADAGIYTPEWTQRTYEACLERAMTAVTEGGRAVVSATFRDESWREKFLHAAHAAGITGLMLECSVPREEALRRLSERSGDASDADVSIYDHMVASWDEPGPFVERRRVVVDASDYTSASRAAALALTSFGLASAV